MPDATAIQRVFCADATGCGRTGRKEGVGDGDDIAGDDFWG